MPLSTSSSSGRAEAVLSRVRWGWTWLLTLGLIVVILGSWEGYWRFRGFTPSITDDWPVWSAIRRAANGDARAVALVGSSRILLGLDPALLEKHMGRSFHMLAIDGSTPIPVLDELSRDEEFIGSVICSIPPLWLAGDLASGEDRTAKWLRKYRRQTLSSRLETGLALLLQQHLVFRYGGLAPEKLWSKWWRSAPVVPPYAPMRADRYRPADYSMVDVRSLRQARVERTEELHDKARMLPQKEFLQRVETIRHSVERIERRGGRVIFVRFPSCGRVQEIEERTVPRRRYWDPFAEKVAAPAIHFADYPSLGDFQCMDGSHLNHEDAAVFTRQLSEIISNKSLLQTH